MLKGILLVLLLLSYSLFASALGDLAASMQPGTFARLETNGLTYEFLKVSAAANVLQYAGSAAWDKNAKKLYFHGAGHYAPKKFIIYSESTNSWGLGPADADRYHGYDHNTVDPHTGTVYHAAGGSTGAFYKYTGAWAQMAKAPVSGYTNITRAIAFLDHARKLLLFENGHGGIYLYTPATNTWVNHSRISGFSTYHSVADYNPNSRIVIFGGGNGHPRDLYKMDAGETVTEIAAPPVDVNVSPSSGGGKFDADPASGKFVYLKSGVTDKVYEYDPDADRWRTLTVNLPSELHNHDNCMSGPIHGRGVIMYVKQLSTPVCYLYKHSGAVTRAESRTSGSFRLRPDHPVTARIYDIRGNLVNVLQTRFGMLQSAGWQRANLPAGVYTMRVTAGSRAVIRRLINL